MKNFRKHVLAGLMLIGVCSSSAQSPEDIVPAPAGAAILPQNEAPSREDKDKSAEEQAVAARSLAAAAPTMQCFSSGSPLGSANDPLGLSFFKVCFTDRGNVVDLESPAGKVHIPVSEGFVVCSDRGATVHGFDAVLAESGWGAPTVSQPNGAGKLPFIVTRTSMDGKIQLTQTFTIIPGEREVQVTMAVKNTSASILPDVVLDRYFDGDLENSPTDDFYDKSDDSVWGVNGAITETFRGHKGLMLTLAPLATFQPEFLDHRPVRPLVQEFANWNPIRSAGARLARSCGGFSQSNPIPGDYIGRLSSDLGDMKPGQTKTYTYRYRRI